MNECSCVYVDADLGPAQWRIGPYTRRARKRHKCSECDREIIPGEKYEYLVARWSDMRKADTYRTCRDCLSVRDVFYCEGFFHEMVWEMLRDHIREAEGQIDLDCLIGLTPAGRERVCEIIEECWEDFFDDDDAGEGG